ncbi:MAG: hypothetical protein K2X53_04460 [Alphaproteobacteria bacterium]|nr:hypothetical protein [Alphaproteobacteria bacterium]
MADSLNNIQKMMASSMEANSKRLRVAAENMANAKSADYTPKSIEFKTRVDPRTKENTLVVKRVYEDQKLMKDEYNPNHPQANESGYVRMPDIDPLTEMMNIEQTRRDYSMAMKVHEVVTDIQHKTIKLINAR